MIDTKELNKMINKLVDEACHTCPCSKAEIRQLWKRVDEKVIVEKYKILLEINEMRKALAKSDVKKYGRDYKESLEKYKYLEAYIITMKYNSIKNA